MPEVVTRKRFLIGSARRENRSFLRKSKEPRTGREPGNYVGIKNTASDHPVWPKAINTLRSKPYQKAGKLSNRLNLRRPRIPSGKIHEFRHPADLQRVPPVMSLW